MWKYVTRRLRETIERAYNVLDLKRPWTCGAQQTTGGGVPPEKDDAVDCRANKSSGCTINNECAQICFLNFDSSGQWKNGHKGRSRKKIDNGDGDNQVQHDLLGALTWSGAIVCGYYASQLLCLHRRQFGWENQGRYKILNIPTRAVHSNVLSHIAFASPVQPTLFTDRSLQKISFGPSPESSSPQPNREQAQLFQVNNENGSTSDTSSGSRKQSVQEAVADLVGFLGDTEFRMGMQNIAKRRYRAGVEHLKLATGHKHPGATFNLGLCYEKGWGVSKNLKRAMECYQTASAMGHSKAMYNLGVFYAQGLGGLEKDHGAARHCFVTAAKLGQTEAKLALGLSEEDDVTLFISDVKIHSNTVREFRKVSVKL